MHRVSLPAVALALGCAAGAADAGSFNASAEIIFQGCCRPGDSRGGASPVKAQVGPVATPDNLNSGLATAEAGRGSLAGTGSGSSNSRKLTSIGQASAVFDDLIFSWDGLGQPPTSIELAVLNYQVGASQTTSGNLGNIGGFNARQVNYSIAFNGSSAGGEIVWDVTGNRGQSLLGTHRLEAFNLPVETPLTVTMTLFVASQASLRQVGSVASTGVSALISVGHLDPAPTGSFEQAARGMPGSGGRVSTGPVFDLPDGFTVNSVSMGVVDNQWVAAPVPEPASWLMFLAGAGALLARRQGGTDGLRVSVLRWRRRAKG